MKLTKGGRVERVKATKNGIRFRSGVASFQSDQMWRIYRTTSNYSVMAAMVLQAANAHLKVQFQKVKGQGIVMLEVDYDS